MVKYETISYGDRHCDAMHIYFEYPLSHGCLVLCDYLSRCLHSSAVCLGWHGGDSYQQTAG